MTDKDKVIKSIECCLRSDNTNLCGECSYKDIPYNCKHALIKDVYELLKEQKAETEKLIGFINGFSKDSVPVVRCKDCKNRRMDTMSFSTHWCPVHAEYVDDDYFCADGKRK